MFFSKGFSSHNHMVDIFKISKLKTVDKTKRDCIFQSSMKPRTAFTDISNTMAQEDEVMPVKYDTMARAMCRVRANNNPRSKAPTTYGEVIKNLPGELK